MTDPVIVGSEIKIIWTATSIPKTLTRLCSGAATYDALWYEGTAYVVPAGKKFICTSITTATCQAFSGEVRLYKHNVADAAGGIRLTNLAGTYSTSEAVNTTGLTMPFYYEVEATMYLNGYISGAGENLISVTGVEVDA